MRFWISLFPLLLLAAGNGSPAAPPATPVITEPVADGQIVNPADLHMEAHSYSDPDGDAHVSSDVEVWKLSPLEKIWEAPAIGGIEKNHLHLGDGTFVGSYSARRDLEYGTNYRLKFRFRDATGEVSPWAERLVSTSAAGPPGVPGPVPWVAAQGYRIEVVAEGFEMPVNIAFLPNPGPNPTDPLFYVTELYGTIKVVFRNGTVGTYAGASALGPPSPNPASLINFNPTGLFPGSGEQGLSGLCVDPATGDVFVSLLYASPAPDGPHYPKVLRLSSTDGGRTASSMTTILQMPGETQGQSHFISNLSIGPDAKLYVHNGDGFDYTTAQNLDSFRGKVLRMNLNGTAPADNPFYNATNGISARDYVWAYGLRNPFGGTWRASDGSHYEVENGPSVDRFAKVVAGRNFGWNNTDASMANFATYNWNPAHAPVNVAFIQPSTFAGSGFPPEKMDHAFISESGPTYGGGPQANGKKITEFVLDAAGNRISGPTTLASYVGTGRGTAVGLAAGPDGLYFTELYKDLNATSPIQAGARIFRVRYVGVTTGNGTGLAGEYFTGTNFDALTLSRTDPTVDFLWDNAGPAPGFPVDNFSVRWTGFVTAVNSETYTFSTLSDDGVRLWVNGQQIINNWTDHSPTENSGQIVLQAGQPYAVKMEFYESGGTAIAQLYWSTASIPKQIIPQQQLSVSPSTSVVAAPAFSPTPGTFSSPTPVTITSATSGASIRYTTDGSTPTSTTGTLYSGPVTISSSTTFKAVAYKSGLTDSSVTTAAYTFTPAGTGTGLTGDYYTGLNFNTLSFSRTDPVVDLFLWDSETVAPGFPDNNFSVRWTGKVLPQFSQTYTFYLMTDDGGRLWVNNQLLVDKWIDQAPTESSGTIALVAGQQYDVKIEYYEKNGGATARLSWSSAGTPKQVVPQVRLYPAVAPPAVVAAPTFSPAPGTFSSPMSVTLASATSGATIRYTTDGSTPTSSAGTIYSAPVPISTTTTFKAIAYKSGMTDSSVSTATYTHQIPVVATPTFSPAPGGFSSPMSVTISTTTAGSSIRYTTDGSTPTSSTGTLYSAPVPISATTTIKAIAYQAGMTDSAVATGTYTFTPAVVANPTYSPTPGTFSNPMSVTIATTTSGASIRYTTDGSAPTSSTGTLYSGPIPITTTTSFRAIAFKSGMTDSAVIAATYTHAPAGTGTGLTGDYYTGMSFNTLSFSRTDAVVDLFLWDGETVSPGFPHNNFSVRWTGKVQPQFSQTYTFYLMSDDGGRLWVNNQLLVDKWIDQAPTEWSGTIALVAGQQYDIKIEFYEKNGGATARLSWASPGTPKEIVPQIRLYPAVAPPPVVAAPTFSPAPGTFSSPMSVTIGSTTSGASIRYTTDGTNPTSAAGTLYTGPVPISATTTFKAIAYKSGMVDSTVSTATYTHQVPVVAAPTYSPAPGTFSSPMSVTISTTTSGASIRYTTNGTNPTPSTGTLYSGPVPISATTTFKAIAYMAGMTDSSVTTGAYTYSPPVVANPTYSPTPGTFSSPMSVTIASATAGASIRYTTDGSTPSSSTGTLYSGPVSISTTTSFRAIAFKSGMVDSAVVAATYTFAPAGTGTGLRGDYYTGMNFEALSFSRTDPVVDLFLWDTETPAPGFPDNFFSIRWTGKVQAQFSQTYTFYMMADDGVRLWVNNQLLVDKWIDQAPTEWSGTIALVAGLQYDIKIEFYEKNGGAAATLSWSSPSTPKQVIPQIRLYPAAGGAGPAAAMSSNPLALQDLVDAAQPGETVTLGAGTFEVPGGLFVPAGVSLKGAGPGRTILTGADAPAVVRLMGGPTDLATALEGLTLTGGTTGLHVGSSAVLLTHVVVARNLGDGIVGDAGGFVTAVHVTVADNGGNGLSLSVGGSLHNSIVSGNGGSGAGGALVTSSSVDLAVSFLDPAALDYRAAPGSATIDAGDAADPYDAEPAPNGGRANQGAYGNTAHAETSLLLKNAPAPATAAGSSGGSCGATGWEALAVLGLLALRRRRR